MTLVKKKGLLMSLFMGATMGLVFSGTAQLMQMHRLIPLGLLAGVIISFVISGLLGLIVPMKYLNDKINFGLFGLNSENRVRLAFTNAIAGTIIFTIPNCFANMVFGQAQGMMMGGALPPTVTNIFQAMGFVLTRLTFPQQLLSTLLLDLAIGYFLNVIFGTVVDKITNKMLGI